MMKKEEKQSIEKVLKRLSIFFEKEVYPKEFAQNMRIYQHELLLMYFESEDADMRKKQMYDGYFFLTLLCEAIDPVLGIYDSNFSVKEDVA